MVEPRMLMVSRATVSPGAEGLLLFLVVILTARRAVFICGETDVIVPLTMVPWIEVLVRVLSRVFDKQMFSSISSEAIKVFTHHF